MPEMIEFPCPYSDCSKLIKTDASFAGRTGNCPHCSRPVTVPGRRRELRSVSTVFTNFAHAILDQLRFLKPYPEGFWTYQRGLSLVGVYAIIIAGVLFAMEFGMLGVRSRSMPLFLLGVAGLLVVFLLHYLAARFALAGAVMLRQNPLSIRSSNVADSVGLFGFIATILVFFTGIAFIFLPVALIVVPACLAAAFLLAHVTLMALNPAECLNIHRDSTQTGEGEAALSVVGFCARVCVASIPPRCAVLAVAGVLCAAAATIMAASGPVSQSGTALPADAVLPAELVIINAVAGGLIILAGIMPVIHYFLYLAVMLAVNSFQSVLSCRKRTLETHE